ncbi:MAG: excinuclease ABC subunit UvrA [Saprospiraceae bacterium]|nr:excinuclease ABC subunit UvrA [Saprospiraceae bacterium]
MDKIDSRKNIIIKGARVHNLKNLDVVIPRNKLIVITGLSGSGKSSLAFDTLYADGQRRYVESLSSYARQFLGRMSKPEVDYIKGISPAIAIQQKVNTRNPRSTVGTSTEIYEYLKLLFARIGNTYSPISGEIVKRDTVTDVVNFIYSLKNETRLLINSPLLQKADRSLKEQLSILLQQGFSRIKVNGDILRIDDFIKDLDEKKKYKNVQIVIDRIVTNNISDEQRSRIADSVQTAYYEGQGTCLIELLDENKSHSFSNNFELDGIVFEEPSVNLFSFNNPFGACKKCEGFGSVIGIDPDLVIPDKSLSIYEEAVACWKGEKMSEWKDTLVLNAYKFDFPVHKPYFELTEEQKKLLWTGNKYFAGLNEFFEHIEHQSYKIQYRVMLSRYRGKTICPDCKGTRLRKDAAYVKVAGKSITDFVLMPVHELLSFLKDIKLNDFDKEVSKRLLIEIINRLQFLENVGLGYLTLNRLSSTLSGGESQRINLSTSLGSSLVGSLYILDEPSIGLHPRDTFKLIKVLTQLRDLGNTVIVVEHDEDIIKAAEQIIDIGPMAGIHGGELVFQGTYDDILKDDTSLTAKYISGKMKIQIPESRKQWREYIEVIGARENNLKGVNVKFPLNIMTVVTGVSGSGKTSLVKTVFTSALRKYFGSFGDRTGKYDKLDGNIRAIEQIELVDQNPIGRSSRSNPVTYIKAYDDIRSLFASQKLAKNRGYKPGFFSFNVEGGRCEECQGDGQVKIEMQFMADIYLKCESCGGKRFKEEVLDVTYCGKNISEILDLTISEAIEFFDSIPQKSNNEKKLIAKLKTLDDVGLGYVHMGQPSSTLSGGEAQRVKLAYFLSRGSNEKRTLFVFDEPTTGLHFHDINKLLAAFKALLKNGHSIIIIEHNQEIIKCADWVIDLGPDGGEKGGYIVFEGTPEELVKCKESVTGKYLAEKLV